VQLFRIASELNPTPLAGNAPFKKFVNETYHIEKRVRDAAQPARVRCRAGARDRVVR
jgi:hypothetical protein